MFRVELDSGSTLRGMWGRGILTVVAAGALLVGCSSTPPPSEAKTTSSSASPSPTKTSTARQWATIIAGLRQPLVASEGLLDDCVTLGGGPICKAGVIAAEANTGLLTKQIKDMVTTYGQPPDEVGSLVGEANLLGQAAHDAATRAEGFCPGAQCLQHAEDARTALSILLSGFDAWAPYL